MDNHKGASHHLAVPLPLANETAMAISPGASPMSAFITAPSRRGIQAIYNAEE
jgi:hypothetical protein